MPHLLIVDARGSEQRIALGGTGEYVIGRDQTADIPLTDKKISRRHARVFLKGGAWWIEDMGSANGVLVRGKPITGATRLASDIQAHIGDFKLQLADDAAPAGLNYALTGRTAPFLRQTFMLPPGTLVVGRTEGNDIVIPDPSVSRKHASLNVAPAGVVVEDHDSSNGTQVNGARVGRRQLKLGDVVRFGNVEFEFHAVQRGVGSAVRRVWNRFNAADRFTQSAVLIGLLAALLLLVIVWVVVRRSGDSGPAVSLEENYERAIDTSLKVSRELMAREAWDDAAQAFQRVLEQDPINREARRGLASAQANRRDALSLATARDALKSGQLSVALTNARAVRTDGPYAAAAQQVAEQARDLAAEESQRQASDACRKGEFKDCHKLAISVLELKADSAAAQALVNEAETALKSRHEPFTPWAPPSTASAPTGVDLAQMYPDDEVRQAALRYAGGDLETAVKRAHTFIDRPGASRLNEVLADFRRAKTSGDGAAVAGDLERAVFAWEEALKADSVLLPVNHPSAFRDEVRHRLAAELLRRGDAGFDRGLYSAAFRDWSKAIAYNPDNREVLAGLDRLEARARAMLEAVPTAGQLDADSCARLTDILGMTRLESPVHADAERRQAGCLKK